MPLHLSSRHHDRVVVAAIEAGRGNALDAEIVGGLESAVTSLSKDQAIVITGQPGIFTGGLDLSVLGAGGEPADRLLAAMGRLLLRVLRSDRPVVVAADGSGVAAGAMLMLAADHVVVSDRSAKFGFAEVRNGIVLPAAAIELIAARADPTATLRLAAHGELVGPTEAVRLGLADQVAPSDSVLDVAATKALDLAALPAEAYASTKRAATAQLAAAMTERTPA